MHRLGPNAINLLQTTYIVVVTFLTLNWYPD